jgi:hypothetical protein
VDVDLYDLMPLAEFKGWSRELVFRQNTFSSAWIDAEPTIGMREATILDQQGAGFPSGEGMRIVEINSIN